jgi:5-deoxy-glucuronate isomerase
MPEHDPTRPAGATIRDVARRAGVSTATVSRILSGASTSRPATVAAVRAAAEVLDYRPSSIARSLKTRMARTLGLIVTDVHDPFFPELVAAVEDAAWAHGLRIILCNGARDPRREADYLALLQDGRVDGLIVAAGHVTDAYAAELARSAVPVVIVNSERADLGVPTIGSDNRGGGRLAAEHLLGLGHTRVGVVTGPPGRADSADRAQGALDAMARAGLDPGEVPIVLGTGAPGSGGESVEELLVQRPDLTGLVCYNDVTAIGVIRALRAAGRRVPEQVSVVGFDDIDAAAWVEPPLTTVVQQKAEMGRWAVRRLVESITGDGRRTGGTERVVLPVSLRVRGSTAAAPPRTAAGGPPAGEAAPGPPRLPWTSRPSPLLRRASRPGPDGVIVEVEPPLASWSLVGFAAHRLGPGQAVRSPADDRERLALVLEGRASVRAGPHDFGVVGSRVTVFDGPPPPVVLVAPGLPLEIVAEGEALIAVASAPGGPVHRTACMTPAEILVEVRGAGQTERRIHHLLPPGAEAGRLIAFEVFTPGGNWSSYPPHKHDTEDPPREARLEELYFYRFARPQGFAFQRVYTPDRSLDEVLAPGDGDLVLVPAGYHPVGAPAGYDCYYLNVMAGPNRAWHFTVDPDHAWLMNWDPAAPRAAQPGDDPR